MFWFFFFFKQKTAYEMRISDWSSDVCSSDLRMHEIGAGIRNAFAHQRDLRQRRGVEMANPRIVQRLQHPEMRVAFHGIEHPPGKQIEEVLHHSLQHVGPQAVDGVAGLQRSDHGANVGKLGFHDGLDSPAAPSCHLPPVSPPLPPPVASRSEEHTSELQSLMRISYAVFCLKKKTQKRSLK